MIVGHRIREKPPGIGEWFWIVRFDSRANDTRETFMQLWHKPASVSYEDAASMGGVVLDTAVQALFYRLSVQKPWEAAPSSPAGPVRPFSLSVQREFAHNLLAVLSL